MKELEELWKVIMEKIELSVSNVSFEMWFKPLKVIDLNEGKLILSTKSPFAKNQILKNYFDKLKNIVKEIFGEDVDIEVLDPQEETAYLSENGKKQTTSDAGIDKNKFDPTFTFDNFVVGKCNQLVCAASKSVAEKPGKDLNPLFIYGGVGLGKTHILHAIGNYVKEYKPNLKIKYVTCEQFTNDYIDSLNHAGKINSITEFRNIYRSADILIIDDVQFLTNKIETQEELFHTFNDLYQAGKQIILSSDRPPQEIKTLNERLLTRFKMGFIQDLQMPDFETRVAILRKKCHMEKYTISDDAIEYIAEKIDTSVRELVGMLKKVWYLANLLGKPNAELSDAKEAFDDKHEEKNEGGSNSEQIIEAVCNYFGITKADIVGKKRNKEIVEPRMIAIYMIEEMLELPLVSIGQLFGGRDHTTIMHARDKIGKEIKTNKKTLTCINEIKKILQGG